MAYLRASAFLAALMVIGYGMLATPSESSTSWLLVLAAAYGLLVFALWPSQPRAGGKIEGAIIRCAVIFIVGFVLISVQVARIQVVESAEIRNRTALLADGSVVGDPRQRNLAAQVVRGSILTRDGQVVAESERGERGQIVRRYPDPATGYLAGFFSPLLYGSHNLERAYDAQLMAREGGNPVSEWLDGILHRTRRGYDLHLTIDAELQRQATQLLGDRRGAVVMLEAGTGAVVAMASTPNFDPNPLYVNVGSDSPEDLARAEQYWEQITTPEEGALVLRPTQGRYVPGSVFKTVTAAAVLDSGLAGLDTVYRNEGALTVGSRVIIERNRPDPNIVNYTLSESYAYSLNVTFAQIGLTVGPARLDEYARRFGIGESIPFDLPVVPSQLATTPEFLQSQAGLAETAFGQGQLLISPLQMALIADAAVTGGEVMEPYLVREITDGEGRTLSSRSPRVWKRAVSEQTSEALRAMMVESVQIGFASGAAIPGYQVGGKTGTAEVGEGEPHAWFIGFAGESEPEYVVAVIVENGGSGGEVALPIGRELLRQAVERAAP